MSARQPFPGRGTSWLARAGGLVWLGLLCLVIAGPGSAQDIVRNDYGPAKKVLLVFSESRDLPGNAMMEQALRAEMIKDSTNRLDFYVENFEFSRFSDADHAQTFREFLRKKYSGQNLDLIVAFMGANFNLTNELSGRVFNHIPVVFVAVSEQEIPATLYQPMFTGTVQRFDVAGTLSLMFRLQPEIHRVVVVSGMSATDRLTMNRIKTSGMTLDGIEFEFWTNRPIAQMGEGLSTLPKGSAILLSTVQRDVAGEAYYSSEVAQMILPTASAPIYVLSAGIVGSGVVGGAVVDFENLGTHAGQLAVERLQGGGTNQIPVEVRTVGTPMVDWRTLRRWGISPSRLPYDTRIRYRPHSTWEDHKGVILTITGVILAQALTIAGLLINRHQRQRAEARARANQEARALVAAIVESSDDAIIRKDLNGTIITWNRAAERLFGFDAAEAIGKPITIIVPASQLAEELDILERARRAEPIHNFETVRQSKSGRLVEVSIAISPIFDDSGKVVGASKICRDITSKKAAEMEIRQQRAELAHVARVSTLGQLTAALTHELNQPLGAILRNAEAAELFLQGSQPDLNEVRAILADIRKDDQRAGQVIERMRSLLKRRSLVSDPLDLRDVVEDTVALVRPDLLARQVKLTLAIPDPLPQVQGDRVHLQQVLLNLILNGLDAMNHTIGEARALTVRVLQKTPGWLEVAVSDGGTGLTSTENGQLFEPFFTTKPNGMGMGLAISRTIIEAHGGKIRAENNPGAGATFSFTLPAGVG
jgi:PAS domain S-box-containing protein